MANKSKMVIKGQDVVKGPRKPKEFSNKPMGVIEVKSNYMDLEIPMNDVVKRAGMARMSANKPKRGKDMESKPRKP